MDEGELKASKRLKMVIAAVCVRGEMEHLVKRGGQKARGGQRRNMFRQHRVSKGEISFWDKRIKTGERVAVKVNIALVPRVRS